LPSLAGAGRYADLGGPSSVFADPGVGGLFNAGRRKKARVTTKGGRMTGVCVPSRGTILAMAAAFALIAVTLTSTARAGTAVATTVPLTFTDTNICVTPAEVFTGMGELHMLVSSNLFPSGMAQSHLHADLAGLHAMTVTGKKYEVPSSFNQSYEVDSFDAAPFHTTLEFLVQYIRVG